jgi:hypothetical protein
MTRLITVMSFGGLMLIGAQSVAAPLAAPPPNPSTVMKRQMSECMTKKMTANKTLSYNDARKGCKERLQPGKDEVASITPVPAVTKTP